MLVNKLIDNMTIEEIDISNNIKIIKLVANEKFINRRIYEIKEEYKKLKSQDPNEISKQAVLINSLC